jgi:hypothetical protein
LKQVWIESASPWIIPLYAFWFLLSCCLKARNKTVSGFTCDFLQAFKLKNLKTSRFP